MRRHLKAPFSLFALLGIALFLLGPAEGAEITFEPGSSPGFAVPMAMMAMGVAPKGTNRYMNPFKVNPYTQSDLGYMAITGARNTTWAADIGKNTELQPLIDIAAKDPWFDPNSLWKEYVSATGHTPDDDSIYNEGTPWKWFLQHPHYVATQNKAMEWVAKHIREISTEGKQGYEVYDGGNQ